MSKKELNKYLKKNNKMFDIEQYIIKNKNICWKTCCVGCNHYKINCGCYLRELIEEYQKLN